MKHIYKGVPFLFTILFCSGHFAGLSQEIIKGNVVDAFSRQFLEGVTITVHPGNISMVTDQLGKFIFKKVIKNDKSFLDISSVGYKRKLVTIQELKNNNHSVALTAENVELQSVVVSSQTGEQFKTISKLDIAMRGVNNSQELLRIIPGLVIGQHQGGGKAEQIFLRGFDADHGTDFRMDVDGLPVNMVSHAHGQGFADSHFIIPETIDGIDFRKGPYTAGKGDFATTGFVDFNTRNSISNNMIKMEGGQFTTYRLMGMFNLLPKSMQKKQSWYVASEYRYSDGYFDHPQNFNRFNLFTKFNAKISGKSRLMVSATTFRSKWNASGQIPGRAVDMGLISFYGALDPYEGGVTSRTNFNTEILTSLNNGDIIKNQLYYSNARFDLHTNFTFFLQDSVNGDEIRQKEARNLIGYNGNYQHIHYLGNVFIHSEAGLQVRYDATRNSELSHTKNRFTTLQQIKLGDISELSMAPYLASTLKLNEHFSINAGLRFDQFFHQYKNKLETDPVLPGLGIYKANANTFSPKLNFFYHVNNRLQIYLNTGKGFHSNDSRSVVVEKGFLALPSAYSADLGTVFKPANNIIINAAAWYIYLQREFVYSGDGGFVEFSGKTRRFGVDFSGRYEPVKSLYFDIDANYARGRAVDQAVGKNYIPLAPVWTSSAGLTYTSKNGLNGSVRYRFIGDRPANENYSLTAKGYFITDAVINFTRPLYEIGLVINNIFNERWKETQFETITRLKNEPAPVDEVCFTAGTPFSAKLSFTVKF
ncbi:MAG: TonB-dependent receptor [Ferruginibacter sp.]|nr:TonB-dependent receptor [Ferruginibacter sp.]